MIDSALLQYAFSYGGAATLTLLLVLLGELITKREHRRALREKDAENARLREANGTLQKANDTLTDALRDQREQNSKLLNSSDLMNHLVEGILTVARERGAPVPPGLPPPHQPASGGP